MKKLVICGDSFNAGIGCRDLKTQPYGVVLAAKLGMELVTLARGSSSNFTTHMQANFAAQMNPLPDVVIIGSTSWDRVEWLAEGKDHVPYPMTSASLNYHMYPPHHGTNWDNKQQPIPFFMDGRADYNPVILSEQVGGIDDYLQTLKRNDGSANYYARLHKEPKAKLELITRYYTEIFDGPIKKHYDAGILLKAYMTVKKKGIRCIVLSDDPELLSLIPAEDIHCMNWFTLSKTYPDTIGSMHASEEAHDLVAWQLFRKLSVGMNAVSDK